MSEKSPRRMPLSLTAEQLDRKDSLARTENKRVRNRLYINKEMLSGHENTNVSSMDYEMRRLKHELRGIKQTSGYFVLNNTREDNIKVNHRPKRRNKGKVSKKIQSVTKSTDFTYEVRNTSKTISLPALPTISSASSDSSAKNSSNDRGKMGNQADMNVPDNSSVQLTLDTTSTSKSNNRTKKLSSATGVNLSTGVEIDVVSRANDNEKTLMNDSKEFAKSDTKFGVDVARSRIHNRLAWNTASSFQVEDNDDLTPYMHVPPDGLPRTAYLLPPLEELLSEAKKARYIRKLRKRDTVLEKDDPERELNIDEIFSKSR